MQAAHGSRTAVLVCQARAVAHGDTAPDRFSDPVAATLLSADELAVVEQVRAGRPPQDWRARVGYESVRASAEVMVPRTVAIDDAVRDRPATQVVLLGAGLDARAWRMPELAGATVYEVDHPASQQDKRRRLGDRTSTAALVRFVPVDLRRDSLDAALADAGHDPATPTTWVWEGVVPYLTRAEVATTARLVGERSATGSRLVVNYQSPSLPAAIGGLAARAMAAATGRSQLWSDEPRRSTWTPQAMAELLNGAGFRVVDDRDLLTVAGQLGMTVHERQSLRTGRVAVADR